MPSTRARLVFLLVLLVAAVVWGVLRWLGPERIEAPRPAEIADTAELPELGPSVLTVPIRIELAPLLGEVEEAVPRRWGSLDERVHESRDGRTSVAVALERGPFEASFRGSTVRLTTTVSYQVRAWYDAPILPEVSASCGTGRGEPRPRLVATLEGPLTLNPEWGLSTRTRVARVAPATAGDRDRCTVTVVRVDMTDRVVEAARSFLEDQREAIDARVAEADVRNSFREWWAILSEPIRLDEATWLVLRPEAIRRGRIRGRGRAVEVTASLQARPRVVLGLRPIPDPVPLPPLETGRVRGRLEILAEGTAQYDAIGDRLSRELEGVALSAAGRTVRITSIRVSAIGGGRVALEVGVEGDVDGRLFLVGTPRYDAGSGYASVPDLEFSVETSNLLVAGASWLTRADVEELLRERARWPVAPAVEWVAGKLHEGLNRRLADEVRLEGTVEEVRILGVTARPGGLVVRAAATADATLHVEGGGR